ncbi:hypothetical protein H6P81_002456 [Aristolochia fimbriata]|uniref:Uncharacterized protein n=1 Tax=Aristolochia fimbriata TaxID=158543 RepID=A0AAV7FAH8_ARIFI|nr:hypothetical protein H6P81_002456 [Aristolochia fimbriata]
MKKKQGAEKEEESRLSSMEIETRMEVLEKSTISHLVKEIVGFVLYMHQQIPSVLQNLEIEFDSLKEERQNLESVQVQAELKATSRREHSARLRHVKQRIRSLEKLMKNISDLFSAVELTLREIPEVSGIVMILGGSPIRPLHVYELSFAHGRAVLENQLDTNNRRAADLLSKKAIRALLSNGAGSVSYAGPMKLFLLVRAPTGFNLPEHFLPKRDFKYSKKVLPFRLHIKCRKFNQETSKSHHTSQADETSCSQESASNDMIWFQCKHTIKGIVLKPPSPGDSS